MPHSYANILIHVIFSTKDRQPWLTAEIRDETFCYLGGTIKELGGQSMLVNGPGDHVHMLIRIRPVQSVAEIARVVKANSSRWVHEKGNKHFAWRPVMALSA